MLRTYMILLYVEQLINITNIYLIYAYIQIDRTCEIEAVHNLFEIRLNKKLISNSFPLKVKSIMGSSAGCIIFSIPNRGVMSRKLCIPIPNVTNEILRSVNYKVVQCN